MNYSLGNMLGGAGALNADKLSLDLQFATDKTLTARKGPTPTFTRASTATFVGSNGLIQSAAINTARFDHDPVTLACKGLLIEESRTNLFSTTNLNDWPTARCTKTAITGIGLTNQATTLTISDSGSAYIFRGTTLTTGVAYAISVRVKAGTLSGFSFADLTEGKYSRNFNLSTNQWGASGGAVEFTNYTVTPNIDGWFLVSAIYTPTGATGVKSIAFLLNATVVGQTVSFDTPQIEAGSFPTSYIPTVASSVVRSADVCSITGASFTGFYNPVEGSFATSQIFNAPTSYTTGQIVIDVNDTTASNRTRSFRAATNGFMGYSNTVGGIQDVFITGSTAINAGAVTKFAGCMKANDFTVYLNSVSQGVDTVATMPSAPTTFTIGDASSGVATRAPIHGTIASIRYYRKRLSNEKLQALTA